MLAYSSNKWIATTLSIPSTAADVGAIANPSGGTTGQVLKKTADGTEWANESGGGGGDSIFWAEYGVTPSSDIAIYYSNGLQVICVYDDNQGNEYLLPLVDAINDDVHVFACATNDGIIYAVCNSDAWTTGIYVFPFPPISGTPADLGTASNGSSTFYARSDHIHSMPSASDVGAIATPVLPSSGDVLTYANGVWSAVAPTAEIVWVTYGISTNAEIEAAY